MQREEAAVALELARLSVAEIVDAAGVRHAPRLVRRLVRRLVEVAAAVPSRRLGATLARFDAGVATQGIGAAARAMLEALGARVDVSGAVPGSGAVLVITNHPGAYDSLAMMAALGRDDVALIAADRPFLRAMPHVSEHLAFVADPGKERSSMLRAVGLRSALAWLEGGHVLVQYGAGEIEADARFARPGDDVLGAWSEGTSLLAARAVKMGISIVPAFVSGVCSPRAKRSFVVRLAERRGITTIAPLMQATLPGFRDVRVTVRFGAPLDDEARAALSTSPESTHAALTARLRAAVAALAPR